ncbi:MAG: hypothetical protein IKZ47_03480 [Clostridia bacterium]|nr:hypothetical protein [Clostridia bacterium]
MKEIKLNRVSYSPGYGDMLGGYHESTLKKDKEGNWICVCIDRETHAMPKVITTYAVSAEAVARFEEFIKSKKVLSLEKRLKSNMFMTDYSPWSWSIDYDTVSFGKTKREYCSFGEYKIYVGHDYKLLNELEESFYALRGEKISETTED